MAYQLPVRSVKNESIELQRERDTRRQLAERIQEQNHQKALNIVSKLYKPSRQREDTGESIWGGDFERALSAKWIPLDDVPFEYFSKTDTTPTVPAIHLSDQHWNTEAALEYAENYYNGKPDCVMERLFDHRLADGVCQFSFPSAPELPPDEVVADAMLTANFTMQRIELTRENRVGTGTRTYSPCSVDFREGVCVLVGPNGGGKTFLLHLAVMRLLGYQNRGTPVRIVLNLNHDAQIVVRAALTAYAGELTPADAIYSQTYVNDFALRCQNILDPKRQWSLVLEDDARMLLVSMLETDSPAADAKVVVPVDVFTMREAFQLAPITAGAHEASLMTPFSMTLDLRGPCLPGW